MIGVIERVKNNVLLKCSTLNDKILSETLINLIDTSIYHFSEDVMSMISDISISVTEEEFRENVSKLIKTPILKKIKRKLFIDSLALQITNDAFIEDFVNKKITIEKLNETYEKELESNKNSNQLNMTENLKLDDIIESLYLYVDKNLISYVSENEFMSKGLNNLVSKLKKELELKLKQMIKDADENYLNILINEINNEIVIEEKDEGEESMIESIKEDNILFESNEVENKFAKFDDMTLFNKVILSLNTKEEKLNRDIDKLEHKKEEVDNKLTETNKNIETNIERENNLSQRRLELNNKELELNSKLSEAEVIFLNMKPLINGLNKIKVSDQEGGNNNE